jgi:hypothetical protein
MEYKIILVAVVVSVIIFVIVSGILMRKRIYNGYCSKCGLSMKRAKGRIERVSVRITPKPGCKINWDAVGTIRLICDHCGNINHYNNKGYNIELA